MPSGNQAAMLSPTRRPKAAPERYRQTCTKKQRLNTGLYITLLYRVTALKCQPERNQSVCDVISFGHFVKYTFLHRLNFGHIKMYSNILHLSHFGKGKMGNKLSVKYEATDSSGLA